MAAFRISKRLAHEGTTWILGSGDLAARAALAIRMTHPGFTARRLFVQRRTVYVAQRVPSEPVKEAGVGMLSAADVKRRIRWLPPTSLASHGLAHGRDWSLIDRGRLPDDSGADGRMCGCVGMGSPACTSRGRWPVADHLDGQARHAVMAERATRSTRAEPGRPSTSSCFASGPVTPPAGDPARSS